MENKEFYRRTIKVGNSCGVLLPKSLLGADVKITVLNISKDPKKEVLKILTPVLENLIGIYIISPLESNSKISENSTKNSINKIEILAVSTKLKKHFEKDNYVFDIVPFSVLKKSIKEKQSAKDKIKQAKTILNKELLVSLRKEAGL